MSNDLLSNCIQNRATSSSILIEPIKPVAALLDKPLIEYFCPEEWKQSIHNTIWAKQEKKDSKPRVAISESVKPELTPEKPLIEYFCPIEWRQTKYDPTVNTIRGSSRATSNIKTEPLGYVPEKPLTEYEQKFVVFEYNRSNIGTIGQGSLIKCSLYLYNNSILGIFWLFSFVKSALFLVLENKMKNYFLCGGGVQYVHFANYNSRSSNSSRK